jgi:hypothetical protein
VGSKNMKKNNKEYSGDREVVFTDKRFDGKEVR